MARKAFFHDTQYNSIYAKESLWDYRNWCRRTRNSKYGWESITCSFAPNLSWKNIELQSILEEEFKIPTIIENEANAGAYGEKKYGVGKDSNHLIYVSVGIGIGVGMILNGQLYKGNNGFSGELGHMSINVKGDLCRCGNEGCWELYASEQALIQQAKKLNLLSADQTDLSFEYLLDLAENGNEKAIYLFNRIGEYLGVGLNNIINIFNPQEIVIGNRMDCDWKPNG